MTSNSPVLSVSVSLLTVMLIGCGSGVMSSNSGSSSSSSNTQAIAVGGGPGNNYANGLFTNVKICAPGTSNCQIIPNVLVDTGSFGLRVLSSALGSVGAALPPQKDGNGNPILECAQFVDSVLWGPVKTADVTLGSETAASLPIEVIDASAVPIASNCKSIGPAEEDVTSLGTNGILGVGFFISDCGNACAAPGSTNPGFYYACSGSSCAVTSRASNLQVQNPIASFPVDNNGVVIQLPSAPGNAPTLSGSMIFGIGTQSNNGSGSAQVFMPDNFGNLKTTFKGKQFPGFLDSGSNAYFFLDSSTTGIADCSGTENGFYCPSSPVSLAATNNSAQGTATSNVNFTIGNASQMFRSSNDFVFPSLGGPNAGLFDWGLPFFFGRKVFVAIESKPTPLGTGPFWAY